MLVLDTDLLTLVQKKAGSAYLRLDARLETASSTHSVRTTIISYEEQMRGWLAFIKQAKDAEQQIQAYDRFMGLFQDFHTRQVLKYDFGATEVFRGLRQKRIRIGTMDLKIAAIVLSRNATLLSRNLSDFQKVPGLRVEDWTQ